MSRRATIDSGEFLWKPYAHVNHIDGRRCRNGSNALFLKSTAKNGKIVLFLLTYFTLKAIHRQFSRWFLKNKPNEYGRKQERFTVEPTASQNGQKCLKYILPEDASNWPAAVSMTPFDADFKN